MAKAPDLEPIREAIDVADFPEALRRLAAVAGPRLDAPTRGQIMALRVICQRRAGQVEAARDEARGAVRDHGQDEPYLFGAAKEFANMGDFQLAEELLRELCQLDPDSHDYAFYLATVLAREDRLEEADRAFDEVIGLDPGHAPTYLHKANGLYQIGELESATRVYAHYLKLKPDDAGAWLSAATAHSELEQYEAAYEAFERATALDPGGADIGYNWAITAIARRDRATLADALERIERHCPRDWRAAATRALLHEYDGDIQGGWIAARRSVELADKQETEEDLLGAIVSCLKYAIRHGLTTPATDILERCFAEDLFDADVLESLRLLNDQSSPNAGEYEVVLDCAISPLLAEDMNDKRLAEDPDYRLVRHFQVYAENDEHAGNIVLQFEAHAGNTDLVIQSIQELRRGFSALLGITYRSRGYLIHLEPHAEAGTADDWSEEDEDGGYFFPRF